MPIAQRFTLLNHPETLRQPARSLQKTGPIPRRHHHHNLLNPSFQNLLRQYLKRRLCPAIPVHQRLQRQRTLGPTRRRDDCLLDFHVEFLSSMGNNTRWTQPASQIIRTVSNQPPSPGHPLPTQVTPPLDPKFHPACLGLPPTSGIVLHLALERSPASISHLQLDLGTLPPNQARTLAERFTKFALWSRGAHHIHVAGPHNIAHHLDQHFKNTPTGRFDSDLMGRRIYAKPFTITPASSPDVLPPAQESSSPLGRHQTGCRIGFDLGASDIKVAAVQDGEVTYSDEFPWDPRPQTNPQWHFDRIQEVLKRAANHLPRVDAIGGSAAGVYVANEVRVASLFRGIPESLFDSHVRPLFHHLRQAWDNIPFVVVNDGEVTALAGSMSLAANAVLGIAMGSSLAAGYVNRDGNITPWLNELAFAPIDLRPDAPPDEWSGDVGCGVQYFSQQGVARLIPASGLPINTQLPFPEQLVQVQQAMAAAHPGAKNLYRTLGVYLGCAIPWYTRFYDVDHLLLLGRVTTGPGGNLMVDTAREILRSVFPDCTVQLHLPDEKQKRHGQAMAAASLPPLN